LRDSENAEGYSSKLWQQMIELGWPAVLVAEQNGGLGLTQVAMGQISEQAGSTLASSPLFATAVVGASALALAGTESQQTQLLPSLVSGELTLALALDEAPRHDPLGIALTAAAVEEGYVLNGRKCFVVDGHSAKQLIVAARTAGKPGVAGGITLFLVPVESAGIGIRRTPMMDGRNVAEIQFDNVSISDEGVLGAIDQGMAALDPLLDIANTHLAAELLGIASECLQRTLVYLKDRTQFGVHIGSFQALQHRAAILWTEIELGKSIVLKALRALDESPQKAGLLASMAKAKTCAIAELATNEGIQMHGGIGMTDEFDMGFFLKRARVAQMLFGDRCYHLDRCAGLSGY
jgi:alkylation response protein AidB-like acyl-CoA dehydrogenase